MSATAWLHRLLDRTSEALVADYFTVLHYLLPTQEGHHWDAFHVAAFPQ
jgi:hypothetical protein